MISQKELNEVENQTSEAKVDPFDAAVELQEHFVSEARRLRRRDWHLQQDLIQDMSLNVILHDKPMSLAYFRTSARMHAIDCLNYYDRRARVPACIPLAQRVNELSEDITEEEQMERDREREERLLKLAFKLAARKSSKLSSKPREPESRKESA